MAIPMQQPFLEIESAYDFASPVGSLYIDKLAHFSPFPKVVNKIVSENLCRKNLQSMCQTL